MTDLTAIVHTICELNRKRRDFLLVENSTILRMRAICRRYVSEPDMEMKENIAKADALYDALGSDDSQMVKDVTAHLSSHMLARDQFHALRLQIEKELKRMAMQLPVWPWVESVHGFGALGLAQIVGEAGDLLGYTNPSKVWKRFGLAPYRGAALSTWRRGTGGKLSTEEWSSPDTGYSPARRSMMFVIGDSLLKKQNQYRDIYLARKAVELAKMPDAAKMVHHRRAQRYMEKRLLRDLWRAWRNLPVNELAEAA